MESDLEDRSEQHRTLIKKALSSEATKDDIGAASRCIIYFFEALRFMNAVRLRGKSELPLLQRLAKYEQKDAFADIWRAIDQLNERAYQEKKKAGLPAQKPLPIVEQILAMAKD
jgi:hypothetical protein